MELNLWKIEDEPMGSATLMVGPIAFSIFYNFGPWLSAGVHISLRPKQVNIHILWFIISVLSTKEAWYLIESEEGYANGHNGKEDSENRS